MNLPESDFQILRLTEEFYEKYHENSFPEILKKRKRAYSCLLFQTHYGGTRDEAKISASPGIYAPIQFFNIEIFSL